MSDTDADTLDLSPEAVPVPDVYVYVTGGTCHLVNGTDYARSRWTGGQETTLCGQQSVPTAADDELPDGLTHAADSLTAEHINERYEAVMSLDHLNLCGNCRASYGYDGVREGINIVMYDPDAGEWER